MELEIRYNQDPPFRDGVFMTPQDTASPPTIRFCYVPGTWYTLLLFDPDAVGGNKIHAMVINISCIGGDSCDGDTVLRYKGPHPPKDSGRHRYRFWLLEQGESIHRKIHVKTRFVPVDEVLERCGTTFTKVDETYFLSSWSSWQ